MVVLPDDYNDRVRENLALGRAVATREQEKLAKFQRFSLVSTLVLGSLGGLIGYGRKRSVDGALDGVKAGALCAFVVSMLYGINEVVIKP